ncbi:effector-associated constant component EACC1 [Nocardia alni]|uniref:effector-associated constant component EACC1 n=1 Tax=Nocardia alni TaxID=2815723 RepID=UPI001C22C11F|nr:hypothetical protein [Nocardia alni]
MDSRPLLQIRLGHPDDASSLIEWLRRDVELSEQVQMQVKVRYTGGSIDAAVQVLSVALGSGGVGAMLANALSTWLTQRHSDITLTVSAPDGRRIELDAHRVHEMPQLLDHVAQMLNTAKPEEQQPSDT